MTEKKQFFVGTVTINEDKPLEIKTFTRRDGTESTVLEFRGLRENHAKNASGEWEVLDPLPVLVRIWQPVPELVERFKPKMVLFVRGSLSEETYTQKDGSQGSTHVLAVYAVGIEAKQKGLTVTFTPDTAEA